MTSPVSINEHVSIIFNAASAHELRMMGESFIRDAIRLMGTVVFVCKWPLTMTVSCQ